MFTMMGGVGSFLSGIGATVDATALACRKLSSRSSSSSVTVTLIDDVIGIDFGRDDDDVVDDVIIDDKGVECVTIETGRVRGGAAAEADAVVARGGSEGLGFGGEAFIDTDRKGGLEVESGRDEIGVEDLALMDEEGGGGRTETGVGSRDMDDRGVPCRAPSEVAS